MNLRNDKKFKKLEDSLNLFEDGEGFLRLRGRFGDTSLTHVEKHPIFLHNQTYFTHLLIQEAHKDVMHHGIEGTLAKFCSRYWITRGGYS